MGGHGRGPGGLKNGNFEISFFRLTRCVGGHGRVPRGLKWKFRNSFFSAYEVFGRAW